MSRFPVLQNIRAGNCQHLSLRDGVAVTALFKMALKEFKGQKGIVQLEARNNRITYRFRDQPQIHELETFDQLKQLVKTLPPVSPFDPAVVKRNQEKQQRRSRDQFPDGEPSTSAEAARRRYQAQQQAQRKSGHNQPRLNMSSNQAQTNPDRSNPQPAKTNSHPAKTLPNQGSSQRLSRDQLPDGGPSTSAEGARRQ